MNTLLRASACAAVLLSAVLLVGCVLVPWLGGPSFLGDDVRELCQTLWIETVRDDAFTTRTQSFQRVLEAKRQVTQEVIDSDLSLREAVDRFRRIERELDDGQDEIVGYPYGVARDDEEVARSVIRWVSRCVPDNPLRVGASVRRLRSEFTAMRRTKSR